MNTDPFLERYIDVYNMNESVRSSSVVVLLCCFVACVKANGLRDNHFQAMVMNFFIAVEATPKKSFDFVSANLVGPGIRSIQQNNAKTRIPPFIPYSEDPIWRPGLSKFLILHQTLLSASPLMTQKFQRYYHYHQPLKLCWRCCCNHFLSIEEEPRDGVKSILLTNSTIECADEIKVAIVSIQCPKK